MLDGAARGREGVVKAGSILVSCKTSCVRDTPSGPLSTCCVYQDLGTMLHGRCSSCLWDVRASSCDLVLQLSKSAFSSPPRTHPQDNGIRGLADGAKPPTTAQPHVPPICPTLITRTVVGTPACLGCSPPPWPWGSLLYPAAPSTSPAHLSPGVLVCARVGCTRAVLPEHPLPARSLSPAWAHAGWLGQMEQGKECLTSVHFPQFRQTRNF